MGNKHQPFLYYTTVAGFVSGVEEKIFHGIAVQSIMKRTGYNQADVNNVRTIGFFSLIIVVTCLLLNLVISYRFIFSFTNSDLRNRIVGARLLQDKTDPYYFQWVSGMDERLLDPYAYPGSKTTRVTIPPTLILLHTPFANIAFESTIVIWMVAQWLFLIASVYIFVSISPDKKKVPVLTLGIVFGASFFWTKHISTGQIYVFYLFLVALAAKLPPRRSFLSVRSLILGFLAALRPTYLLLILPFLILRKTKFVLGIMIGLSMTTIVSLLIIGVQPWYSYFSSTLRFSTYPYWEPLGPVIHSHLPKTVEGFTYSQNTSMPSINTSLEVISRTLFQQDVNYLFYAIAFALILLVALHKLYKVRATNFSFHKLLIIGLWMVIVAEIFMPFPRYLYTDIQLLAPISLSVAFLDKKQISKYYLNKHILLLLGGFVALVLVAALRKVL